MENPDRPAFNLLESVAIENARNIVDKRYWDILRAFQIEVPGSEAARRRARKDEPPSPKEPSKLLLVFCSYAGSLFHAEVKVYPSGPHLAHWLEKLRGRIIDQVMNMAANLEDQGEIRGVSLTCHGVTPQQIVNAMCDDLDDLIEQRLQPPLSLSLPLPPDIQAQIVSNSPNQSNEQRDERLQIVAHELPELERDIARRFRLLSEYKAATGNPSNKKICEAQNSCIHRPEFYKWKQGKLPPDSKTTKSFEAFLKAQRRLIPKEPTR
jgi:hypothetical protein